MINTNKVTKSLHIRISALWFSGNNPMGVNTRWTYISYPSTFSVAYVQYLRWYNKDPTTYNSVDFWLLIE